MTKFLLSAILVMLAATSWAQESNPSGGLRISLQAGLSLSTNRVNVDSDTLSISSNGTGGRFSFGPIFDIPFGENYYFTTGLLYTPKRSALKASNERSLERTEEVYRLQYLQIPLALKLFTSEVALDTRIFFQVGGTLDINPDEAAKNDSNIYVDDYRLLDLGLMLGVGAEFKVGAKTTVFAGFNYQRGLTNTVTESLPIDGDLSIKNDLLSIIFGVKL